MNKTLISRLLLLALGVFAGAFVTQSVHVSAAREAEKKAVELLTDACAEHCFPFVSRFDLAQEPPCWCADLGGTWHPDTW